MSAGAERSTYKLPRRLRDAVYECIYFPEKILFMDIETTGLSHFYDEVTIIGWSLCGQSGTFVKGDSFEKFNSQIKSASTLITFNGIRFDVPFLKKVLPGVTLPENHIDLMYLCRRAGLHGGQKKIEKDLSIEFRDDLEGIDGRYATILWHRYLHGDLDALRDLIRYNRADIAAMGSIFEHVLKRLGVQKGLFEHDVTFSKWSAPQNWDKIDASLISRPRNLGEPPTFSSLFEAGPAAEVRVVGIDLTGSEARASGWSLLDGSHATACLLKTDEKMIKATESVEPDLVSIDSPLCLPAGRNSAFDDDPKRFEIGIMRKCERILKKRGINVYPCLLPSMQKLTDRGIRLAEIFREKGIPVIESYPGAAQDIMRIPRKGAGIQWLQQGLREFGIRGDCISGAVTHDELDAVTSALVGTFHLSGLVEELGTEREPPLIVPCLTRRERPIVVGISGPIAAGKTTLAHALEREGFAYTRFSLVIDDLLRERGLELSRSNRQALGAELNQTGRQRELAERTLERVRGQNQIVVDGLRFPSDHAYLVERFGLNFLHVFVDADSSIRRERYSIRGGAEGRASGISFDAASGSLAESAVPLLADLAHCTVSNEARKEDSARVMLSAIEQHFGDHGCLSQSS